MCNVGFLSFSLVLFLSRASCCQSLVFWAPLCDAFPRGAVAVFAFFVALSFLSDVFALCSPGNATGPVVLGRLGLTLVIIIMRRHREPPCVRDPVAARRKSRTPRQIPLPPPPETLQPTATLPPPQPISRVFIVTFDGLRPDAIDAAGMTNVQSMMQSGAYTLTAQTIMPSTTLPAHAALVTGTCPAKNTVRWNEYVPQNGYAIGTDIFDLTRSVGLRTVLVAGKEKLRQITESTDFFGWVDNTDEEKDKTTLDNMALEQIEQGFGLMMVPEMYPPSFTGRPRAASTSRISRTNAARSSASSAQTARVSRPRCAS